MNTKKIERTRRFRPLALALFVLVFAVAGKVSAASWNGIEPNRSTRADVERVLGAPEQDDMAANHVLRFKVAGGTVVVSFVDAQLVAAKKLKSSLLGTVQQIMLIHDGGSDTPETLKLVNNPLFEKQENNGVAVYRDLKDGIAYSFIGGTLKSTYYFPGSHSEIKTLL